MKIFSDLTVYFLIKAPSDYHLADRYHAADGIYTADYLIGRIVCMMPASKRHLYDILLLRFCLAHAGRSHAKKHQNIKDS
jgi:hypothetical protein